MLTKENGKIRWTYKIIYHIFYSSYKNLLKGKHKMKQCKRLRLYFILFSITMFMIISSGCQSKHEKSMNQLKQMSRGSSLVEKGNPGFWFKVNKANKLEIIFLDEDSDARRKGFKDGDIITIIDSVEIKNKYQFFEIIDNKKPTETMTITVTRNGESITKQIRLNSVLLPTILYALMEPVYKNESVILAPFIDEFNITGAGNKEEFDSFKKTLLPQLFSIVEGSYLHFFGNEKNFRIVDRNDVEHIINELKLQQSGLTSKETQLKIGNMLGATHLLIGNYSFFPNKDNVTYMVAQRLVDVATGKVLATTVVEDSTNNPKIMQSIRELKMAKVGTSQTDGAALARPVVEKFNSRKKNFSIAYDTKKWKISKNKLNEASEISFIHEDGEIFAFLINERFLTGKPQHEIEDFIIENIKKKGTIKDCRLVSSKIIKVNGVPINHLYIEGNIEGRTLSIFYYVYTGKAGLIQFVASLPKDLFEEYSPDVIGLLNGLQVIE